MARKREVVACLAPLGIFVLILDVKHQKSCKGRPKEKYIDNGIITGAQANVQRRGILGRVRNENVRDE